MATHTSGSAAFAPGFTIAHKVLARGAKIKLALFDVDGVLTDGSLYLTDSGEEIKAFNSRDGHGMKMLVRAGVETGIITGRTSKLVEMRAHNIEVKHLHQGAIDKLPVYEQLIAALGLAPEETAFIGDDVVDLPIMLRAGLAVATADAHPLVTEHAHWVTPSAGGRGAGREFCEMLMHAHGAYCDAMKPYLT